MIVSCKSLKNFQTVYDARTELMSTVGNSRHPDYKVVGCGHCLYKHIVRVEDTIEE